MVTLILITLIDLNVSLGQGISSTECDGVQGIKIYTDYNSSGKPYVRKILTDLYNAFDDDHNFTHLIVHNSKFKNENVEVYFEVLNHQSKPIKKILLNKWLKDKDFPNQKILKIPVSKIIRDKLSEPHDRYLNLSKEQKAKTKLVTIPFDGKFYVGYKNKPAFCTFDFKYAYKYQE